MIAPAMFLNIRSGSEAGKTIRLTGERFVVGREDTADLVLDDTKVSREHAGFTVLADGRVALQDLGSTNGTYVNGRRIEGSVVLDGTETIQIGDTSFTLTREETAPAAAGAPATTAAPPPPQRPPAQPPFTPPQPPPGPPPGQRPQSQSVVQRIMLQRSVRRANLLAIGAVAVVLLLAGTFAALYFTGVIAGDDDDPPVVAADDEPTVAEIIDAARPSTGLVVTLYDGERLGSGTGWVLDADEGLIVTNDHVTDAGDEFQFVFDEEPRDAELVATAPCEDLSLLRVDDTEGLKSIPLGSQENLEQGETVVAVGYPVNAALRDELTATTGVVSVVETEVARPEPSLGLYPNVIRTDAAINPGNSGGPLITPDMRLVGVNTLGFPGQNENYAIGVDRVKEIMETLREGTSIGWIGVELEYVTEADFEQGDPLAEAVNSQGLPYGLIARPAIENPFGSDVTLIGADGEAFEVGMRSYCEVVGEKETGEEAVFGVVTPGGTEVEAVELEFQ
jgi:S1-C subfamily serine protease